MGTRSRPPNYAALAVDVPSLVVACSRQLLCALSNHNLITPYIVPRRTVLHRIVPHRTVLLHTKPIAYRIIPRLIVYILDRTGPDQTGPYRTRPYRTVRYCAVPHRTAPYSSVPYHASLDARRSNAVYDPSRQFAHRLCFRVVS